MTSTSRRKPVVKRPKLTEKGHRSKLEDRVAAQLQASGIKYEYETLKLKYTVPARQATYTPDFPMGEKPIILEVKGYFDADDRQKLALVKEQHPDLDIRLVFQRAKNPIRKGSPTSYAKWAETHGFPWSDGGVIPQEWIAEAQ